MLVQSCLEGRIDTVRVVKKLRNGIHSHLAQNPILKLIEVPPYPIYIPICRHILLQHDKLRNVNNLSGCPVVYFEIQSLVIIRPGYIYLGNHKVSSDKEIPTLFVDADKLVLEEVGEGWSYLYSFQLLAEIDYLVC